ncbi:7919_t:CDS:2 [Acaulospora morrowiae]|uniref:7919_t:CDS:1 n=1 Tax=Acaulospora morrowiae TaxID=94023 RepID=A0A9N8ZT45_9GLOM|nr:7919_t:CDS:2 [Acaulospora morrowiae]
MADKKPKLSDNLLGLKFMQRQMLVKEGNGKVNSITTDDSQWIALYDDAKIGKPKFNVKYIPSYLSFMDSEIKGRLTFGNRSTKDEKDEELGHTVTADDSSENFQSDRSRHEQSQETSTKHEKSKGKRERTQEIEGSVSLRKFPKINDSGFMKPPE